MTKAKHSEFGSENKPIPNFRELDRTPVKLAPEETNEAKAERQKDKLPTPKGWRILVIPISQPTHSAGGIAFTEKTKEDQELASTTCQVISLGPMAYTDEYKFMGIPWCKAGDFIQIARYTGSRIRLYGANPDGSDSLSLRVINDDEVLCTVPDPHDYVGLA